MRPDLPNGHLSGALPGTRTRQYEPRGNRFAAKTRQRDVENLDLGLGRTIGCNHHVAAEGAGLRKRIRPERFEISGNPDIGAVSSEFFETEINSRHGQRPLRGGVGLCADPSVALRTKFSKATLLRRAAHFRPHHSRRLRSKRETYRAPSSNLRVSCEYTTPLARLACSRCFGKRPRVSDPFTLVVVVAHRVIDSRPIESSLGRHNLPQTLRIGRRLR